MKKVLIDMIWYVGLSAFIGISAYLLSQAVL